MDEENRKMHISEAGLSTDYSLEDILAEFRGDQAQEPAPEEARESLSDRSKKLVMEQLPEGFDAVGFSSLDDVISDAVSETERPAPAENDLSGFGFESDAPAEETPGPQEPAQEDFGFETAQPTEAEPEAPAAEAAEAEPDPDQLLEETLQEFADVDAEELTDSAAGEAYAPAGDYISDGDGYVRPNDGESPAHRADNRSARERFLSPFIALLALISLRRGQRAERAAADETAAEAKARELPEPEPDKAVRAAAAQLGPLKMRGRIAIAMSLILIYLTYAASSVLPLTGALGRSPRVLCLMMLILELTVMMAGLNIFTDGMVNLCKRRPDAKSLVALSCVFTAVDAVICAVMDAGAPGLPLCAASAISMTVAVWGEYCRCSALRRSYKVLTSSRNLYTVSGEQGITKEAALLKSRRGIRGFIRRSLEPDYSAGVFRLLTPMLLIASVVLGALSTLAHGMPKAVVHAIAMCVAASSAFSVTLCFSLPYAIAARRFGQSGAAVAGWPGVRDIGRSRNVIITDGDVFPKGTLELGDVRILEGAFVDKVISATASVIAASGSGLAMPFAELIRRNGYSISRVENFEPHDGGGMTAMVNGESVAVGNTGFMNLIGVRVPQKLSTHNAVCTAMNGSLVGIFFVNYRATGGVQEALVTLLHSNLEPIFALRDFNITPQMLKTKFRLPADNFKFPSYSERFRISAAEPDKSSRVAAAIAREGMQPLVDAAERGRRLYSAIRIGTWITAVGCVFGLLMMFLLSWTKTFDLRTSANVVTCMLLWLIPAAVVSWGVNR